MKSERCVWLLIAWSLSGFAWADARLSRPFQVHNQNPFVDLVGLPRLGDARLAATGQTQFYAAYNVASHFEIDDDGAESVIIDGETERLDLIWRRGFGDHWEAGVNLPLMRHSGGYLDNLIIDWHDWFNLPQNGRDRAARDRLVFLYDAPGERILLSDDASGIGDVQAFVGRSFGVSERSRSAVRAHVKLPTGEADDLLGSGGTDVSLTLHHERALGQRLLWGISGGVTFTGSADVLDDLRRPAVGHLNTHLAYQLTSRVSLKLQWDVHSAVYEDSDLLQLNEIAYVMGFGGAIKLTDKAVLEIIVTENYPHPEITPDVAFGLGLQWYLD
ncbi:MAG: DUF3187 family protein [Pseudomonadota bacterium]